MSITAHGCCVGAAAAAMGVDGWRPEGFCQDVVGCAAHARRVVVMA